MLCVSYLSQELPVSMVHIFTSISFIEEYADIS